MYLYVVIVNILLVHVHVGDLDTCIVMDNELVLSYHNSVYITAPVNVHVLHYYMYMCISRIDMNLERNRKGKYYKQLDLFQICHLYAYK